jgi:hypothetical protein
VRAHSVGGEDIGRTSSLSARDQKSLAMLQTRLQPEFCLQFPRQILSMVVIETNCSGKYVGILLFVYKLFHFNSFKQNRDCISNGQLTYRQLRIVPTNQFIPQTPSEPHNCSAN